MARAATADELIKLRSDHQATVLYLAIHKPGVVYTARVNQSSFDAVLAEVIYDNGNGTLGNVLPGMTMYVGTSAGAYDKGMVRIRKAPTEDRFYIGETAEIAWSDNDYLTIVDEFGLWSRHIRITGNAVFMDYDVAYSDQHSDLDPVPVFGPPGIIWLQDGLGVYKPNAGESFCLGSSISSYQWSAPGASATSGMTSAVPEIEYSVPGQYRVSCTVTAANGKSATGHRMVFVYGGETQPVTLFELLDCSGDRDAGGWEYSLKLYDQAAIADVRERALCVLFARDFYAGEEVSLGPLAGYEHVVAVGWISAEDINWGLNFSTVEFTVRGPAYWLKEIPAYPVGLEYSNSPSTWTQMAGLTVDRAIWHLLHWRSTASQVIDIRLSGESALAPLLEAPSGKLWQQLIALAHESILANPVCDRLGRLWVQVHPSFLPDEERAAVPTVMEISRDDWREQIDIERRTAVQATVVEASGISFDGSTANPLFSRAPGNILSRYGEIKSIDRLLISSQSDCNRLAGMLLAYENNEWPYIELRLGSNNRLIDIAPRQRITISMAALDTPRGLTWNSKKFLPKRIELEHNARSGIMLTALECEAETSGLPGVTYNPPQPAGPDENLPPVDGRFPGYPLLPPPSIWIPPVVPPPIPPGQIACLDGTYPTGPYQLWPDTFTLNSEDENLLKTTMYLPCAVRPGDVPHKTMLIWYGVMERKLAGLWQPILNPYSYMIRAIDGSQNILLTGINAFGTPPGFEIGMYRFYTLFQPVGSINVHGFRMELNPTLINDDVVWIWDFNAGPQGWTNEYADYPDDAYWTNGKLNVRSPLGWANQRWRYLPPSSIRTRSDGTSKIEVFGHQRNGFVTMAIQYKEGGGIHYYYMDGGPTLFSWDISGVHAGNPIEFFQFMGLVHAMDYGNPNWISYLKLSNFVGMVEAYRITIHRIDVYNVCPIE